MIHCLLFLNLPEVIEMHVFPQTFNSSVMARSVFLFIHTDQSNQVIAITDKLSISNPTFHSGSELKYWVSACQL